MNELEIPKKEWGPGPWQDEPDRLEWKYKGFPCLMVRNTQVTGSWCGYVAVSPEHMLFEKDYGRCSKWFRRKNLPECWKGYCRHRPESILDIHGGLTYSNRCQGDICHEPAMGEPDNVWWLGFDCSHGGDLMPRMRAVLKMLRKISDISFPPEPSWEKYRDVAYVKNEVERLADQLAEMK